MMATTHVFMGMALAATIAAAVAPEHLFPLLVVGAIGGLVPDFDVVFDHRKTFHFPVFYSVATVLCVGLAIVVQSVWALVLVVGMASAALHSVSDIFGNGNEYNPWNATSQKAVYNHALGRWHRPRYVIRYDGAPEDLFLCAAFAVPVYLIAPPELHAWILLGMFISAGYAVGRKPIGAWAERHGL